MDEKTKFYGIESKSTHYGEDFRFYSLYNGARGAWTTKTYAIKEGEAHQRLILSLHGRPEDKKP